MLSPTVNLMKNIEQTNNIRINNENKNRTEMCEKLKISVHPD